MLRPHSLDSHPSPFSLPACLRVALLLLLSGSLSGYAEKDADPADRRAEADAHYERMELAEAAAIYLDLLESDGRDPGLRIRLADCLVRIDRFVEGIDHARVAVQLSGGRADALAALGKALHRQGDFDAARERLLEGLEADPDCAECLWALARIRAIHGEHGAAAEGYRRAAALEPENPRYLRSLAAYVVDREKQMELYRRYLELPARDEERVRKNAEAWLAMLEHLGDRPLRKLELPEEGTEVRLDEQGGMSFVTVRLGSPRKLRYLLDTGASGFTITARMMRKLKLEPVHSFTITGIGGRGTAETTMVLIEEVQVGEAVVRNVPAVVRDVPGADGLLGPSLFGSAVLTLDQRKRWLRVHGRGSLPENSEAVEVPFLNIGGTPFLPIHVDGVAMHAMVDTGASQAVLSPYAVEQVVGLELMAPGLAPPAYREIRGATGATDTRVVQRARLELAGTTFDMAAHIPDESRVLVSYDLTAFSHALETEVWAILGNPQLDDFVLTIDWGRQVLRLARRR